MCFDVWHRRCCDQYLHTVEREWFPWVVICWVSSTVDLNSNDRVSLLTQHHEISLERTPLSDALAQSQVISIPVVQHYLSPISLSMKATLKAQLITASMYPGMACISVLQCFCSRWKTFSLCTPWDCGHSEYFIVRLKGIYRVTGDFYSLSNNSFKFTYKVP